MGVGALSSDYVTKLGSKEVSKRLRNFIPRPYDGRGCHEVTDEGESQIAQSLQEDPFCTKSKDFGKRRQVRDDNTRGKEHLWSLEVDKILPASDVIFVDFAIKVVVNTV